VGNVAGRGEGRGMRIGFWLGNVKRPLGRRRSTWENNIIMDHQEIKWAHRLD